MSAGWGSAAAAAVGGDKINVDVVPGGRVHRIYLAIKLCQQTLVILHTLQLPCMDTMIGVYEMVNNDAAIASKHVCLGVKGVSPQERTVLLQSITDALLSGPFRAELRDMFNQKLTSDP